MTVPNARKGQKKRTIAAIALIAAMGLGGSAWAQQVPPFAEPGRIDKTREKLIEPKSTFEEPSIPPASEESPPEKSAETTFELKKIVVEAEDLTNPGHADPRGSRVYDVETEFEDLYRKYVGKPVSIIDIFDIANAITTFYRNNGFFLSQAYVPPQTIEDGEVIIRVVEGYIDRVTIASDTDAEDSTRDLGDDIFVKGSLGGRDDLFRQLAKKIRATRPIHIHDLERYTLLARDLPGVEASSRLSPSEKKTGASDLEIVLKLAPFEGSVDYDNFGTRTAGPWGVAVKVGANNALGLYEKTTLSYRQTTERKELRELAFSHEQTLNSEGTRLVFSAYRNRSEAGSNLAFLDLQGQNTKVELMAVHPFIRLRRENLSGHIRFTYRNSLLNMFGDTFSEDRIRAIRVGGTFDNVDKWNGTNLVDVELHQGVNIFNATEKGSPLLSRGLGRSDFTKLTALAYRKQRLPYGFGLTAAATAQWSAHELLASEEFGYGGRLFGRAYDTSEISGDHGWAVGLELLYSGLPSIPEVEYYPYVFYDFGAAYSITPIDLPAHQTGASAGGGIRFKIPKTHLSGSLEFAKPLTRPVHAMGEDGDGFRTFFKLRATY